MSSELIARLEAAGLNPSQIADIAAVHEAEIAAAKPKRGTPSITLGTKKGGKGTVCVYGLSVNAFGQWYPSQWVRFLAAINPAGTPTLVHEYILKNHAKLSFRSDEERETVLDECRALVGDIEDESEDEIEDEDLD